MVKGTPNPADATGMTELDAAAAWDQSSPWNFEGESAPLTTTTSSSTLIEGRTFCIAGSTGDMTSAGAQGLFFLDTRYVNQFQLLLDGEPVESLGIDQSAAFEASFVGRHVGSSTAADVPTVVIRKRAIGKGMTERIEVRNYGNETLRTVVTLLVDTDFANLFAVKEGRVSPDLEARRRVDGDALWFEPDDGRSLGLKVSSDGPADFVNPGRFDWTVAVEPGGSWSTSVVAEPWLNGAPITSSPGHQVDPRTRIEIWNDKIPEIASDHHATEVCVKKALSDLASLRIFDPAHPEVPVVAAGAPWFMTLFGRDSLIASWMALIVDPDLAVGVLRTLARMQGTTVNPATDEEPGKIMHEIRFSNADSASLDAGELYYGTADATPLFVMLLAEAQRWGVGDDIIEELLPNADRALAWMEDHGDHDGDGYIEYQRSTETGLANQGWKDSWDGIRYGDGRVAEAPIALCEVQAYAYGAYRGRARLADVFGDRETSERCEAKARDLREAFNRDFWLEEEGCFAVGLDADKAPIDSVTSNVGHALWAGIVDADKADRVARRLLEPDMFTGWGIRTLSSNNPGYNPTGYHVGSVWPHDTALVAAGLARYGHHEEAHRIMLGLMDAGAVSGGRLPELMAGFDRDEFGAPMAYPASCSPQAWAAAAPLLLMRWLLRFDPWVDQGRLWVDPLLPAEIGRLSISGIRIGEARIDVQTEGDGLQVDGVPDNLELRHGLRLPDPREAWG